MPAEPHAQPTPAGSAPGPLAGLRVIDCSTVLAGPYCTMLLGDLGADVVKVEPPEGDATRGWGPPWVGSEADGTRTAAYYLAVNRNKRSLRLDLRRPEGAAILRRLLADADVARRELPSRELRPARLRRRDARGAQPSARPPRDLGLRARRSGGVASRLRLRDPGHERAHEHHRGGRRRRRGPDQGGRRDQRRRYRDARRGGRPRRARRTVGGRCGRRPSRSSGTPGQRIDISLLGSTLAALVNQAQNAFVSGVAPVRRGNAHPNIVPYETFETADGAIAVAVGSEWQWPRFCEAIDRRDLAADPRFATNGDRVEHRAELRPLLAARFRRARHGDMARGAGGRRCPVRPDPRRRRGVRVARGDGARDDRRAGAPGLGRHPPGRCPVRAERDARHDPARAADPRPGHRRGARRSRLRRPRRSMRSVGDGVI